MFPPVSVIRGARQREPRLVPPFHVFLSLSRRIIVKAGVPDERGREVSATQRKLPTHYYNEASPWRPLEKHTWGCAERESSRSFFPLSPPPLLTPFRLFLPVSLARFSLWVFHTLLPLSLSFSPSPPFDHHAAGISPRLWIKAPNEAANGLPRVTGRLPSRYRGHNIKSPLWRFVSGHWCHIGINFTLLHTLTPLLPLYSVPD